MAIHDTIGDYLTSIRNSCNAGKETCTVQYSKLRLSIARILKEEGYILDFKQDANEKGHNVLTLTLKYQGDTSVLEDIQRASKPGRRLYFKYTEIPKVLGGMGISILSTSRGILKNQEARKQKVGGELICTLW